MKQELGGLIQILGRKAPIFVRTFGARDHTLRITVENGSGVLKLVTNAISTDAIST